ncbi:hypothetical protein EDB81DRAFT_939935 [Dactylonectria macrodidyma]|uniref:Uncharacterized protein n=1 Tax=Dactylonectria macrodidyma TaxID=307937 RepID=A0A9P9FT96_9HYPO|nr:hypothetical protein EDB81DRAFT_939935 [Dactylonectria macrodidyma]
MNDEFTRLRVKTLAHPQLCRRSTRQTRANSAAYVDLCFYNDYWQDDASDDKPDHHNGSNNQDTQSRYVAVHMRRTGVTTTQVRDDKRIPMPPNYFFVSSDIHLWPQGVDADSDGHDVEVQDEGEDEDRDGAQEGGFTSNLLIRASLMAVFYYMMAATIMCIVSRLLTRPGIDNVFKGHLTTNDTLYEGHRTTNASYVKLNVTAFNDFFTIILAFDSLPMGWTNTLTNNGSLLTPKEKIVSPGLQPICNDWPLEYIWDKRRGQCRRFTYEEDAIGDGNRDGNVNIIHLCIRFEYALHYALQSIERSTTFSETWWHYVSYYTLELLRDELLALERIESEDGKMVERDFPLAPLALLNVTLADTFADIICLEKDAEEKFYHPHLCDAMTGYENERVTFSGQIQRLENLAKDIDQFLYYFSKVSIPYYNPQRWYRHRRTKATTIQRFMGVRRNLTDMAETLRSWLREDDAILAEKERLRAFVQQLLDHAYGNNTVAFPGNVWRQRRLSNESQRWCLYPDCPPVPWNVSEEEQTDVVLVMPSTAHLLERLNLLMNDIRDVRSIRLQMKRQRAFEAKGKKVVNNADEQNKVGWKE